VTRRERFLAEINAIIPWKRLVVLIEPHYQKAGKGRQPLRLYWKEANRKADRDAGVRYRVNRRGHASKLLTDCQKAIKRTRSRKRASCTCNALMIRSG